MNLSVSTLAYSGHAFSTACESIAESGFQFVEPAFIQGYGEFSEDDLSVVNAQNLKSAAVAAGLSCRSVSAHVDMSVFDGGERMRRRLDFAATLGARYLITNAGDVGREVIFAANIESLLYKAEELNVVICLENPGAGTSLFKIGSQMAAWKKRFDHPFIDLNYDVGNIFTSNDEQVDPADDVLAVAGSAAHYHIKDILSQPDGWHMCGIGKGSIDYQSFLPRLAALQPKAPLTIEMPLRLYRPMRGAASLKPVMATAQVAAELKQSREFIERHFRPDLSPEKIENGARLNVLNH